MSSTFYFRELKIRNFLSFGNNETVFDLSAAGTVLIEGQNLDLAGQNSNGSGKTAVINAICYALYNKPFDNISLQRLINSTNAMKNTLMEVSLSFERAGDEYEIQRTRGEQFTILLFKNGVDITPGKNVTETDRLIEEVIGVSYELFTKTIIFSGNAAAFLQLPIAAQRLQIEELFNITLLSEKAKVLKELSKNTEGDLSVQLAIVKQQEQALELRKRQLSDAEYRITVWESTKHAEITRLQQTLDVIGTVDFEIEQLLHDEKTTLLREGAEISMTLAPAVKDKQILTKGLDGACKELEHLSDATCPYCSQHYADAPSKISDLKLKIARDQIALALAQKLIDNKTSEQSTQRERLGEVTAAIQHTNLAELITARENVTTMQARIGDLQASQNPHEEAFLKLESEDQIIVQHDKVDELKRRLEHQQFLLKLLTNKDSFLRRRIISRTIPFLNARINHYTAQLGLPHIVKFDADLSCTVSEFGRELDFGNLSAGEKKRVNIGMALAFRDVLHHLHAKSNLLLIDELDGQLDGSGVDAIIRILKEKSRDDGLGVYVISHHQNTIGRLDRTIVIQKQNGFSTVLED